MGFCFKVDREKVELLEMTVFIYMGGRLTLIKSILSSIPIYFLSCFKCSKDVTQN